MNNNGNIELDLDDLQRIRFKKLKKFLFINNNLKAIE